MAQPKSRAVPHRSAGPAVAEPSDGQLLGCFNARRDDSAEAAFAALIHRHGPMVWRVCGQILGDRHDTEDAFQASFLVLARRSSSIRQPELLGNWLYGVALRTAREARMRDGRRRRREAPVAGAVPPEAAADLGQPASTLIGQEELAVLHEEVARLPERYRVPLVLCELEGLTYQEVARRMRCPVSTIGVRLIRARERLRGRLIRRGIAPAAALALADALFGAGHAAAFLSAGLVGTTARAAVAWAASDAAALGLVPAAVLALVDAVVQARKLAQLKAATSALLVVGLTATLGWVGGHRLASPPPSPASAATSSPIPVAAALEGPTALLAAAVPVATSVPPAPLVASPLGAAPADRAGAVMALTAPAPEPLRTLASVRRTGREELARGEALFFKEWAANDPTSPQGDGLGPVFNETSCVACHGLGGPGGAGSENRNVLMLTATFTTGQAPIKGLERIHPGLRTARSTVVHRYGTDPNYRTWRTTLLSGNRSKPQGVAAGDGAETVEDRIRRIAGQTTAARNRRSTALTSEPGVTLRVSERNSPALFGAGQIDSITSAVLDEEASAQPAEIRGRVNHLRDGRVGRFGWKAQVPSLHEFVRAACASELGLEVPGHAQAVSPLTPTVKAQGLDLTEGDCDALVAFVRALPAPVVVDPDGPHGSRATTAGRRIFAEVGCASCHAPTLGPVRGMYSDLLMHSLGASLSDGGSYYGEENLNSPGSSSPGEWRTPPLWGFRDSGPYLHDGRAEDLEEAVALHEGQGAASARQFFALTGADRAAVETFLKSLVAPSTATLPGIVLAAEWEARVVPDEARQAEALVRQQRKRTELREIQRQNEANQRQLAQAAAKRALNNFQMAANLDRSMKPVNAIKFYSEVIREAPDSEEGRLASERIALLTRRVKSR